MSVAHELSGLGSTRVVRFHALRRSMDDEPDGVATGPQDGEVWRRIEPMGAQATVGDGSGRDSGMLGAAVPALPGSLRGGGSAGTFRPSAGQGVCPAGADRQGDMDAR